MRSIIALSLLFVAQVSFAGELPAPQPKGKPAPAPKGRPSAAVLAARLDNMSVDPQFNGQVLKADVLVNGLAKEVTLTLLVDTCPKGAKCAHINGPTEREITLPIVKQETDGCGARMITAKKDLRPVDGAKQQLVVIDNTKNICESVTPWDPTIVTYEVETAGFGGPVVKMFSTFSGEALYPAKK